MNPVDTRHQVARRAWHGAASIVVAAAGTAVGLGLAPRSGAAATIDPARGVSVTAITAAADYPRSHGVYAIAERPNCQTACAELLRSRDGGATWGRARASGWQPGGLTSLPLHSGAALVAWWPGAVAVSVDDGDSFTSYPSAGSPSSAAVDHRDIDVAVSSDGGPAILALPGGRQRSVPGAPGLDHTALSLTSAYPSPPAGVPAAPALRVAHASGTPRLAPRDATLSWAAPIAGASGGAGAWR